MKTLAVLFVTSVTLLAEVPRVTLYAGSSWAQKDLKTYTYNSHPVSWGLGITQDFTEASSARLTIGEDRWGKNTTLHANYLVKEHLASTVYEADYLHHFNDILYVYGGGGIKYWRQSYETTYTNTLEWKGTNVVHYRATRGFFRAGLGVRVDLVALELGWTQGKISGSKSANSVDARLVLKF